jgi:hypothetical protein
LIFEDVPVDDVGEASFGSAACFGGCPTFADLAEVVGPAWAVVN